MWENENIENSVSMTIMCLLAAISKNLDYTPPAYLIASMIACASMNHSTSLQIDLGVMMRNSKKLVNVMNALGVTCSYDEVLRFKKSDPPVGRGTRNKAHCISCRGVRPPQKGATCLPWVATRSALVRGSW